MGPKPTRARRAHQRQRPRRWWPFLSAIGRRLRRHHVSALAAATAYYGLLSIFPALGTLVSLYGLVANPVRASREIAFLAGILPPDTVDLLARWIETVARAPRAQFGLGFILSLLFALWTMWSATAMLMTAIDICHDGQKRRGLFRFDLDALLLTAALALLGAAALALVALLPLLVHLLPSHDTRRLAFALIRWPILIALAETGLTLLYRQAAIRGGRRWDWFSPGTLAATILWLLGSLLFALYVSRLGSYSVTYGPIGAAIVLLLWLYMSAYVALIGAEINAEAEVRPEAQKP